MRTFTEEEIEKYYEYAIHLVGNEEDIAGRCTECGRYLNEIENPEGPEKKVVCAECRENFVEGFKELEEMGEL